MLILGIDTATTVAAVGVVQAGHDGRVLADVSEHSATGHVARLPDLVARALTEAGVGLGAVNALAVSVGPGSFTGLRVGLCFAKGIAFASGARLVGVGTLEALAATAPPRFSLVATVNDARRGETYVALFRRTALGIERVTDDMALTPGHAAQAIARAVGSAPSCVLLGDGAERYPEAFGRLREQGVEVVPLGEIHPRGSTVARLGERRLERGESDRVEAIVPLYVRASAAEQNVRIATLTTENAVS